MCVKIAQDVLAQIRFNRYKATPGTYVQVDSPELNSWLRNDMSAYDETIAGSFKDFFKKNKKTTCQVCALGAAFVSLVNIENKCSVYEIVTKDYDIWPRVEKYFGERNMTLMESAFECCVMDPNDDESIHHLLQQAGEWGSRYDEPEQRLRAIMLNVIRNNGDFKLPKKYIARAKSKRFLVRYVAPPTLPRS